MSGVTSKSWCFVINNYTEKEVQIVENIICNRIVAGREVGKKGTPHIQGAITFKNCHRKNAVRKMLGNRAHVEKMRGKWEDQQYCQKDGDIIRVENNTRKGERTDITKLKKIIDDGGSIKECAEENFAATARIYKFLERYQDLNIEKTTRTWMTEGIWIYGKTGVGKSHEAFKDYDHKTHYVHQVDDKGWWDRYNGQEIVILNDFRGEIPYATLLNLIDKWPYFVPRRGRATMPFLAKKIIITSSLHPEDIYTRQVLKEDSLTQLLRRIDIKCLTSGGPAGG